MNTLATLNEDTKTVEPDVPNAMERCDRCGAQAYVRVMLENTERLLFCGHHGRRHTPALVRGGFVVLDYSEVLHQKPAVDEDEDSW